MNPTSVLWRGLTLGHESKFRILTVEGWEGLPPSRYDKQVRANGHGSHPSRVWGDERVVTVTGFSWSSTERDALLEQLEHTMVFGDDEEPLAITVSGRTLTAGAQLLAAQPALLRGEWGIGRFGWLVQWRCPDPRRYGAVRTAPTGLPTSGGGLAFPLFAGGVLDFGALGNPGRITLTNPGSAEAAILFGVTGPLLSGFEISAAGQRLTYPVEVPAGQVIEIDTAAGTVLVEGTASRRGNLTAADWLKVPAASLDGTPGTLTVQFTSLGGYDPAARLDATWSETNW